MIVNKDSVKMNNISMAQYLVECKFGYHKIWGKNTGRNLAGSNRGTLLGIFPKLTMQFRALTKDELELLSPHFNMANQTTEYYDPELKAQTTLSTYSGDWEITNKRIIDACGKNEGFSIAFISNDARE